MANGKTIGRERPPPDRELVELRQAAQEEWETGVEESKATPRERAALHQVIALKRQLAAAEARAAGYAMGCDPRNPTRPVLTAFEREREFERIVLGMEWLTPTARAAAVQHLIDDTKSYVERRDAHLKAVEAEVAKKVVLE